MLGMPFDEYMASQSQPFDTWITPEEKLFDIWKKKVNLFILLQIIHRNWLFFIFYLKKLPEMPKFYSIIRILFTRSTGTFSRVVLNFLNGFLREIKFEFEQISLYFMKFVVCVANLFLWVDLFFILQKHKICIDVKCIDGVFCHFWGRTTFILELTMLVGWVFSLVSLKFLKLDFQTSRVYSTDLWKLRQVSRNSTTMSESSARALSIRQFLSFWTF